MSGAFRNLGTKIVRRTLTLHKPLVRLARQRERAAEHRRFRAEAHEVEREIAAIARGTRPILVGPWLAEVGYEVLYWIPFLRWFADKYAIPPSRLIVVSRGGVADWYAPLAGRYVDLFDLISPQDLAEKNRRRQEAQERGGQKQSGLGAFDREILDLAEAHLGVGAVNVCHPSVLFRLFKHVWYGNLPLDFLWTRTRFVTVDAATHDDPGVDTELPQRFAAVKFYSGVAVPMTDGHAAWVRDLVRGLAASMPVVALDSDYGIDEHRDFDLSDIPNVTSARRWMTPSNNLGLQSRVMARASCFVGTCGGLAWLAPFLGVPTTAVFADDQLLGTHLMIARQAVRATGAAEFSTFDLRAAGRLGFRRDICD
jgi:hypothetical protein